jgi:hypothetical protein
VKLIGIKDRINNNIKKESKNIWYCDSMTFDLKKIIFSNINQ